MSIEIEIFATTQTLFTWAELRTTRQEINRDFDYLPRFDARLRMLGTDQIVEDSETLMLRKPVYLDLGFDNTLSLMRAPNSNLNERDFLEDYGTNLDQETIEEFISAWKRAGYYYVITSMAGRCKYELDMAITLATSVARLCSGGILVLYPDVFTLSYGVYTPEQFIKAKPITA